MESWVDPEPVWTLLIRRKSLVPARYRITNQDFSVVHPIAKSHNNKLRKLKYGGRELCSVVGSWTNMLHHHEATSTDNAPYLQRGLTNGWRITNLASSDEILMQYVTKDHCFYTPEKLSFLYKNLIQLRESVFLCVNLSEL